MDERGGAASVEMALLWGAITLLILGVVQVALVFYAGQLALSAAQDGLSTGRAYGAASVADAARADAEEFLSRAAGSTLVDVRVDAAADDVTGMLRVRVEGTALSLVPGLALTVTREAVGPLERLTP